MVIDIVLDTFRFERALYLCFLPGTPVFGKPTETFPPINEVFQMRRLCRF